MTLLFAFAVAANAANEHRSSRCGLASTPDVVGPILVLCAGSAVGVATWMLLRGRNRWLRLGGAVAAILAVGVAAFFLSVMAWAGHCAN